MCLIKKLFLNKLMHTYDWGIVDFGAVSCNDHLWMSHICNHSGHLTSDTIKLSPISTWHNCLASRYKWEKIQGRMLNIMWCHSRDENWDFMMAEFSTFSNLNGSRFPGMDVRWCFKDGNPAVTDGFPHKGALTRNLFPFDDVIMWLSPSLEAFRVCSGRMWNNNLNFAYDFYTKTLSSRDPFHLHRCPSLSYSQWKNGIRRLGFWWTQIIQTRHSSIWKVFL